MTLHSFGIVLILLRNTVAKKYEAYLNLGDWKLPLENNPGYCLFAAYNDLNRIMASNVPALFHVYLFSKKDLEILDFH